MKMDKYSIFDDDWELSSPLNGVQTVVLVGCTGNGKSATGNSILGRKALKSMSNFEGVTTTCELQRTILEDGQILNVIDTPGLFDYASSPESTGKEIARCIAMAKDGIHAILIVVSLKMRFTREQAAAVETLQNFFGSKIGNYMIVVFTGGDDLEEDETLEDRLACSCPEALKIMLGKCGNRRVVFDNRTKDESKKAEQVESLLALVNDVVMKNGGKPYTDELFEEFKRAATILHDQATQVDFSDEYSKQQRDKFKEHIRQVAEEQMKLITSMVNTKLEETAHRLEQKLAESNEEIIRLKEDLERAQREAKEQLEEQSERAQKEAKERAQLEKISKYEIRELREQLERAQRAAAQENKKMFNKIGKCTML